jgi:hypothetical protein
VIERIERGDRGASGGLFSLATDGLRPRKVLIELPDARP